MRSKYYRSCNR